MQQKFAPETESAAAEVRELIARRAKIQQWLQRLDAQRGTVSANVLERVRGDYEQRLRETVEALTAHRASLDDEIERATKRLAEATQAASDASEALEEVRLRHAIGELADDEWKLEEAALQADVDSAQGDEDTARADVERVEEVLSQLREPPATRDQPQATDAADGEKQPDSGSAVAGPAPENAATPEAAPAADDDLTWVTEGDATDRTLAEPTSFLTDIDRALADADDDEGDSPAAVAGDDEPDENTAPKPGLKCAECGYTNDLSAWFCGVCGADIG
ncbi:MAG: hypothetical protein WD737_06385 [Gemmatimonadota bacterium]